MIGLLISFIVVIIQKKSHCTLCVCVYTQFCQLYLPNNTRGKKEDKYLFEIKKEERVWNLAWRFR